MFWATRLVEHHEVRSIADLFREQSAAFDPAGRMLLVSLDQRWPTVRLWVALPEDSLLAPYYGFTLCPRADLPVAPALVAGDVETFARVFHGR